MAQLVWRYATPDPDTAHLVYIGVPGRGGAAIAEGLAGVPACARVDLGRGQRWLGDTRPQAQRLADLPRCADCASRLGSP